jgi:hypothetical protein
LAGRSGFMAGPGLPDVDELVSRHAAQVGLTPRRSPVASVFGPARGCQPVADSPTNQR